VTRTGALTGAICATLIALLSLIEPAFFGVEWLLHDSFARRVADRRTLDPRILLLTIDEKTSAKLEEVGYGRVTSLPRDVHAAVVRELMRAGAAVVAFDLTFPEEDIAHPDADRDFASTVVDTPTIIAVNTATDLPPIKPSFGRLLWRVDGPRPPVVGVKLPFFDTAPSIGTIRIAESPRTSVIHSYALAHHAGDGAYVPSLALEAARIFLKGDRSAAWSDDAFVFNGRRIPINEERNFSIRWSRINDDTASMPLESVLTVGLLHEEGTEHPQRPAIDQKVKGRIVVIGLTAQGSDIRSTPLAAHAAGMVVHANAIDNLINNDFNREANRALVFFLMIAAAALFGGILHTFARQVAAGAFAVAILLLWAGAGFGALAVGYIVPTFAGMSSIALTYIVITVIKYMAEQRHSGMLKTTFGRYVSPQILEHVLAHPEKVELGGERRDLTILFSDIRGFTSISEASEPEQVVEMLNEYLTRMVEILLAHGGTLDKFIGDAVMGFWNAPAPDPDHPRHAVACALEMIEETARIRARWETQGKASIRIGIGVNTGDAVVGNIGAEKVFGYTVIGDAVNLASRLESKNKDYGTEIIISEFTLARIGSEFETVYLDEVKVKGKERAVRIYEVKGKTHA
jgi:adenylate cyclase